MSTRGMHAGRSSDSLHRGVCAATIPLTACILSVINRQGRVARPCDTLDYSVSADRGRRENHLTRLAPDRRPRGAKTPPPPPPPPPRAGEICRPPHPPRRAPPCLSRPHPGPP